MNELRYRVDATYWTGGRVSLRLDAFKVIKTTPRGVWIDVGGEPKWVSDHTTKRFAYPTVAEAQQSFVARKRRQIVLANASALRAKQALTVALSPNPVFWEPTFTFEVP